MHGHVAKAMASAEALGLENNHLEWFQFLGGMVTNERRKGGKRNRADALAGRPQPA